MGKSVADYLAESLKAFCNAILKKYGMFITLQFRRRGAG